MCVKTRAVAIVQPTLVFLALSSSRWPSRAIRHCGCLSGCSVGGAALLGQFPGFASAPWSHPCAQGDREHRKLALEQDKLF